MTRKHDPMQEGVCVGGGNMFTLATSFVALFAVDTINIELAIPIIDEYLAVWFDTICSRLKGNVFLE